MRLLHDHHAVVRCFIIFLLCYLGDGGYFAAWLRALGFFSDALCNALGDSFTHGTIGVVVLHRRQGVGEHPIGHALFIYMCSVGIDVDHFFKAHSVFLSAAIGLDSRPLGHCFSVVLGVCAVVHALEHVVDRNALYNKSSDSDIGIKLCRWVSHLIRLFCGGWQVSYLLGSSIFLHHVRDSWRRGFWLCPLGSWQPPYALYIVISMGYIFLHNNLLNRQVACVYRRNTSRGGISQADEDSSLMQATQIV